MISDSLFGHLKVQVWLSEIGHFLANDLEYNDNGQNDDDNDYAKHSS